MIPVDIANSLTKRRRAIRRQAAARLIFSLSLFVVFVIVSTTALYQITLSNAAQDRAEDLSQFFGSRLNQLENEWEMRTRDIRVRIEYSHFLEHPETGGADLKNFITVTVADRNFQYLQIENHEGRRLFTFGKYLDMAKIPLLADASEGYYFDPARKEVYRVFAEQIWLGEGGMGRIAAFYRIDHTLLQQLATPGVTLTAIYQGMPVSSSLETGGASTIASPESEKSTIPWSLDKNPPLALTITAPVKAIFTNTELVIAASVIPIIDAMILWFVLGTWLMRQAKRINWLGEAVRELSTENAFTKQLHNQVHNAKAGIKDEIHDVADIIEEMAKKSEIHELELRQHEDQRRLWGMVFSNSNEAIIVTNKHNRIITVNPTFALLTGYTEAEVIGKNPSMLSSGKEGKSFYTKMWETIEKEGHWEGEIYDRRKDGRIYPKWLTIVAIKDNRGAVVNYVGTFIDITERKKNEEHILHLATHDALTGLPNRTLLLDHISMGIAQAQRNKGLLAVMFLDLDRFKLINDSLGHEAGDYLLMGVGKRLLDSMRSSDTVARIGGDEFVILLTEAKDQTDVSLVAGKVIEQISRPFVLNNREFHITTSIGISLYPNDGADAEHLLKNADAAMYSAKAAGKNQAHFFDIMMNQSAVERFEMENGLREALTSQQFHLAFQPKQCLHEGVCGGAEALLRWNHPKLGSVSPARFIPIAEETGLINAIGEWVLRRTCQQIRVWRDANIEPGIIAINISAQQLESPNFAEMVAHIVQEFRLEPNSIEFELTESAILQNPQQSIEILEKLGHLGINLSLDDFGTGYSSLSYLKRLPVDTVKIDRSFVDGLPYNEDDAQIVRMTVAMAKSIGLNVVAEGVENPEQLGYLKDVGCDLVQGFYISRPVPSEQYEIWLKEYGFTICTGNSACGQKRLTY